MTAQEEIAQLLEEIKKMEKLAVYRARRFAIMFGVVAIAMLLSFVYAFVQQVAAERLAEEALRQKEKQALLAEAEALRARDQFEYCQHELTKCRASQK